jgi:hypothetical protein
MASRRTSKGLPAEKSIVAEKIFVPAQRARVSAARAAAAPAAYRIIRTTEVDAKDKRVPITEARVLSAARLAPPRDEFAGTSRKKAKLSISDADLESFNDLKKLIDSLPAKKKMTSHKPKITTTADSGRVQEEERNVRVRAFLYAASREDDSDYHLIVGRSRASSPMYMTIELSGLPRGNAASFAQLKKARDTFKKFFGDDLPGTSYDFYDPPIPIDVKGSLFFDMSHAKGTPPGPPSLRGNMPVIWEIHPISSITFEP